MFTELYIKEISKTNSNLVKATIGYNSIFLYRYSRIRYKVLYYVEHDFKTPPQIVM